MTEADNTMYIQSDAFEYGGSIPQDNTQEGRDDSPDLSFGNLPTGTVSLALISHDPDVPDPAAPVRDWVHWLWCNCDPTEFAQGEMRMEGFSNTEQMLEKFPGITVGLNDRGEIGWKGPRPPIGTHRYFFTLHALDTFLDLKQGFSRKELLEAMNGHVLATAQTMGTYCMIKNR